MSDTRSQLEQTVINPALKGGALQIKSMAHNHINLVRVWPDYDGPASNYASRVGVGIRAVPTSKASEPIASLAVGLLGMSADAALPGSIARVDETDSDSRTLGLVSDLALQVGESPRVQGASLRPGSSDPCADAIEFLEGDAASGAFGSSDDLFGNYVIHVRSKAGFLAAALLEQPLRALGPFGLELLSQPKGSTTKRVEMRAAEVLAVAGGRDVYDANVDAEPAESLTLFGVGNVDGDEQVELAVAKNQIGFAALVLEQSALMVPADERNPLATSDGPDVGGILSPRQDARVVGDGAERSKRSPGELVELVAIRDLCDATDDHLRGQIIESSASVVVRELVEIELAEALRRPCAIRNPVARGVRAAKCLHQCSSLLTGRLELDLHNELHPQTITCSILDANQPGARLRPALKGGVSALEI